MSTMPLQAVDIMKLFPHRYPFLMLDRVLEQRLGERVVALKNVSANEPQMVGHFPGSPIFPGVLQIEAMAQAAGLLFEVGEHQLCILSKVDRARFRTPVRPGDQLLITGTFVAQVAGVAKARATAEVDGVAVASAELTYGFVAKEKM